MKSKNIIAIMLAALFAGTSCEEALEETPYSFVSPEQLGNTEEAAQLWVNGAYNTLNSGSFFLYGVWNRPLEVDADDITGKDYAFGAIGAGNFSGAGDLNTYWSGPYTLINRCNAAIASVNKLTIDEEVKNNALGQLYFFKAWSYFMLVQAYGPIPLFKTSVQDGENPNQPRASVSEIYAHIIENLKEAETKLYTRKNPKFEKGRIGQEAAKTLLAKVYTTMASGALNGAKLTVLGGKQIQRLSNGTIRRIPPQAIEVTKSVVAGYESFNSAEYFALARDKAKEVMDMEDGVTLGLFPTYMSTWEIANRNGKEHLWQQNFINNSGDYGTMTTYQYVGITPSTMGGSIFGAIYGLSDHWYQIFEEQDQRITEGVIHRWQMFTPPAWHYYPLADSAKVRQGLNGYQPTDQSGEDQFHTAMLTKFTKVANRSVELRTDFPFPFIRYAETLLIYAEAANEANGGPSPEAYAALNKVRRRSGASEVSGLNQQEFRSMVLEERRRELAMEGHRAWDLRRWGIYLPVMNAIEVDANNVIKRRQERHLLFPIPVVEMNSNPSIGPNNPGW